MIRGLVRTADEAASHEEKKRKQEVLVEQQARSSPEEELDQETTLERPVNRLSSAFCSADSARSRSPLNRHLLVREGGDSTAPTPGSTAQPLRPPGVGPPVERRLPPVCGRSTTKWSFRRVTTAAGVGFVK